VNNIKTQNTVRTPAVNAARRSVPSHLFLPGVSLKEAVANEGVYTKHDDSRWTFRPHSTQANRDRSKEERT
jgi:hypothetical protein